jgi:hypothetical protein
MVSWRNADGHNSGRKTLREADAYSGLIAWAWNVRAEIADTGLHPQVVADAPEAAVTATWLGVTTLLFDDGETQILIDGFISRPSLFESLTKRPVTYDAPMINYVMNEYQMRRLAAIIPAHSHYDHAMDAGAIANRSSASILGSETTANIARGAGVPEDQIVVAEAGSPYSFGDFTVTLVPSAHAPIGLRGEVPLAGTVDEPLALPGQRRLQTGRARRCTGRRRDARRRPPRESRSRLH